MMAGFASGIMCSGDIYGQRAYYQGNDGRIDFEDPGNHRQTPYTSLSAMYASQMVPHLQAQNDPSHWQETAQPFQMTLQYPPTTLIAPAAPMDLHQAYAASSSSVISDQISSSSTDVAGGGGGAGMGMESGVSPYPTHCLQRSVMQHQPATISYMSPPPPHADSSQFHGMGCKGSDQRNPSPVSISSPQESSSLVQHHYPVSIDKELIFLNSTLAQAFAVTDMSNSEELWSDVVQTVFDSCATVVIGNNADETPTLHNVQTNTIAELLSSLHNGGVRSIAFDYSSMSTSHVDNSTILVTGPKARCHLSYITPVEFEVVMTGHLELRYMDQGLPRPKISLLRFAIADHKEMIDRQALHRLLLQDSPSTSTAALGSESPSPLNSLLASSLTRHGLPESSWSVLMNCTVSPAEPPLEPLLSNPPSNSTLGLHQSSDAGLNSSERSLETEDFCRSPHSEEALLGSQTTLEGLSRRSTRSSSAGADQGNPRSRKGKRSASSYTVLVVEEPMLLSECDVHEDLREVKVERMSNYALDTDILDIVCPSTVSDGNDPPPLPPPPALLNSPYDHNP